MNTNTKYWSLTWDTNRLQRKLPQQDRLHRFLESTCTEGVYQLEKGSKKGKKHYQGYITLDGPRKSKKWTLDLFQKHFKNISGLTISPVYDKISISRYVTKSEGRIEGPFFVGRSDTYDMKFSSAVLRDWQSELFEILRGEKKDLLKDRKVVWIEDEFGNTGKSWFQKWLRLAQNDVTVRHLPISSVSRLVSAVTIVTQKVKVDVFTIDFTRTKGKDQYLEDLFSTIEQIKNGSVIDVMYGKYNESYFEPPVVMIFTNDPLSSCVNYLSRDRWEWYKIMKVSESGDFRLLHVKDELPEPKKTDRPKSSDWFSNYVTQEDEEEEIKNKKMLNSRKN